MLSQNEISKQLAETNKSHSQYIEDWFNYLNDPTSIDQQRAIEVIRWRRTGLLHASDWTQTPDCTVDKKAWANYRQQLRDLPLSNSNPKLIVFPQPPEPLI